MIEEKEDFSVAAGIILAVTAALFIFYNINNYFKRTSEIEEQRTVSEFEIMITEKLMNLPCFAPLSLIEFNINQL